MKFIYNDTNLLFQLSSNDYYKYVLLCIRLFEYLPQSFDD